MPAHYQAPVPEFLSQDEDTIVGRLSTVAGAAGTEITSQQLDAWRQQIGILKPALTAEASRDWHLLLEYSIPRRGKRLDTVLLAEHLILVIEFKCGARKYDRESRIQVEDYCLDLRDFHSESRGRTLVPILVATHADHRSPTIGDVLDSVAPICFANAQSLGDVIERVTTGYLSLGSGPIDPYRWDTAEYAPTPTIVEAARVLYEGKNVREITRCHAGAQNLTLTCEAVMQAIEQARLRAEKLICFVTGVPGSGKTLAGLNVVHNRDLHEEGSLGVFLSGNGPLVRVLSEALARDQSVRMQLPVSESRRQVSTFIQNVHRFIDAHFATSGPPPDRVIVFDEAQRAWNREQSLRKFKRDRSEPQIMLDVMDRHSGWAVIVALIGGGQEINTGEAGLSEWGRALEERFQHWHVLVSPQAVIRNTGEQGDPLFLARPPGIRINEEPALHLEIPLRSYKAQAVSDFVAHLLTRDNAAAGASLASCSDFPIVMTRDFQAARQWLKRRQRGSRRIGLVASSGGRRLRPYGLDVRADLEVEEWFLNGSLDVRSSFYLETPATEFGIQGLELDWTGVCWDLDLVPEGEGWCIQAFKGTRWQSVRDAIKRQYVLNKYRVLLTRAREGMVIWVPKGDPSDWTRPEAKYDDIAGFLKSCGVAEI